MVVMDVATHVLNDRLRRWTDSVYHADWLTGKEGLMLRWIIGSHDDPTPSPSPGSDRNHSELGRRGLSNGGPGGYLHGNGRPRGRYGGGRSLLGGGLLGLLDLSASLHVFRPVRLLAVFVAVVCVPTAVILGFFQTVVAL